MGQWSSNNFSGNSYLEIKICDQRHTFYYHWQKKYTIGKLRERLTARGMWFVRSHEVIFVDECFLFSKLGLIFLSSGFQFIYKRTSC